MILVGSKALKILSEEPIKYEDIDLIGSSDNAMDLIKMLNPKRVTQGKYIISLKEIEKNEFFDTNNVDILLSNMSESLSMYLEYVTGSKESTMEITIAPFEVLYSLNKSHIHFPINFHKHIEKYTLLSKYNNNIDVLDHITKINFKETEIRLGELKTPKLNKSAKKFFGQSNGFVTSYFIHDDIHKMVAHFEKPVYTYMQPNPESAMCSKSMWDNFNDDMKLKCVLEESYVIALERKVLPMIFGGGVIISSHDAFKWALGRVCTTLCSGWFREYATNNYHTLIEMYNDQYTFDFLQKYNDGLINRCI